MRNKIKLAIGVSLCAIAIVIGAISSTYFLNQKASALSESDIMKRALAGAMLMCYRTPDANFENPIKVAGEGASKEFHVWDAVKTNGSYVMPTNVGNKLDNRTINCNEVFTGVRDTGFFGGTLMKGIIEEFGKNEATATRENLGYVPREGGAVVANKKCIHLNYKKYTSESTHDGELQTNSLCFPVDNDGKVDISNPDNITQEGTVDKSKYGLELYYNQAYSCVAANIGDGQNGSLNIDVTCLASPYKLSFDEVVAQVKATAGQGINPHPNYVTQLGYYPYGGEGEITVGTSSDSSGQSEFMELNSNSAVTAMNWLSGQNNGFTNFTFGDNEWAWLYNQYIAQLRDSGEIAIDTSCKANETDANVITLDNGQSWCKVDRAENVTKQFAGQDGNSNKLLRLMSFTQILDKLKKLDYNKVDSGLIGDVGSDPGASAGELSDSACYDAAAPLGWIVCPVIKAVGNATGYMYEEWISPMLNIKASELFTTSDNEKGVYGGWSTFRSFSNILFAIAFVVVILAQITGIGISNYNIKKILPRLIMVVVLVNISFILCQLAVDVSNILGSTLKNTLERISVGGEKQKFMNALGTFVNGLGLGAGVVAGVATLAGSAVVAANAQYFLIPLLLAILGCAVSVLFFFIMLGARQAAVVILIVLAPVAIVCYALPNTKPLFDKWRKLFTAMLVVYPVCGLLMGGGNFVSALLLSSADDGWDPLWGLVAMLVSVVPFFMVPSLVRGSMAGLGNLGAKIQGLGAGLRGGLTRGIKGTKAYQEHQAEMLRNREFARNQTRVGRYSNDKNAGGGLIGRARRRLGLNNNLSEYQTARLAQAQSSIDKMAGDTGSALRIAWENDGSADNLDGEGDSIMSRYEQATRDLMADPTDHGALERQRAAASILLASGKGRAALYDANSRLTQHVAGLSGRNRDIGRQILGRTANNLLRSNAGDIKRSALLDAQFKRFKGLNANTDYSKLGNSILSDSLDNISTRSMAEMHKKDLQRYINAAATGQLSGAQLRTVAGFANKALTDQHYKGSIEAESLPFLNQLASMRHSTAVSEQQDYGDIHAQIAQESSEGLDQIAAGLKDNTISDEYKNEQNQIIHTGMKTNTINNLGEALMRAIDDKDDYSLSASSATKIQKILSEQGVSMSDLAAKHFGPNSISATKLQEKIDEATGIRVPHPAHPHMDKIHPGWGRATQQDVARARQIMKLPATAPDPFVAGEWIEKEGTGKNYRITKMTDPAKIKQAEIIEDAIARDQAARKIEEAKARERYNQNKQNP